jgi:multiple sugar transport system permease protein
MSQRLTARRRTRGLLWHEALEGWLYLLPWLVGFVLFTAGPMVASAIISLTQWEILTAPRWVGLDNYARLVADPLFWRSLWNTVYYAFLGVPIYLAAALAMAMLLNLELRGIAIYRTIYFLPSLTPAVASAVLWVWIFNPDFGLANGLLNAVGLPGQKWLFDARLAKACFILMGLWGAGQQMIIFLAGLQGVPGQLYEAASIDGANQWQRFWRITIPMLSPAILFNLVIGIIGSFQVFTTAFIATNGGPQNATLFYVLYLYRNAFDYFKMGYASALAWVLFLIVLGLTLVQFRLANRFVYYEAEGANG